MAQCQMGSTKGPRYRAWCNIFSATARIAFKLEIHSLRRVHDQPVDVQDLHVSSELACDLFAESVKDEKT